MHLIKGKYIIVFNADKEVSTSEGNRATRNSLMLKGRLYALNSKLYKGGGGWALYAPLWVFAIYSKITPRPHASWVGKITHA